MQFTGDGYSYRELKDHADLLKEQLLLVPGIRKIVIDGAQAEVVYLEMNRSTMAKLGITGLEFRMYSNRKTWYPIPAMFASVMTTFVLTRPDNSNRHSRSVNY